MQKIISWFSFASGCWIPEVQQAAAEPNISKGDDNDSEDIDDDKVEDDVNENENCDSEEKFIHYNFCKSKSVMIFTNVKIYRKRISANVNMNGINYKGSSRMFKQKKTKRGTCN